MKKETLEKAKELEEDIRSLKEATTYFRNQRWSHWDLNDRADTFHFDFCKNYSEGLDQNLYRGQKVLADTNKNLTKIILAQRCITELI